MSRNRFDTQGFEFEDEFESGNKRKKRKRKGKKGNFDKRQNREYFKEDKPNLIRTGYKPILPKNQRQQDVMTVLEHDDFLLLMGSAGTGKTFVPCVKAAEALVRHEIRKIVLTRPNVECGESLGALPGELDEKFEPWLAPLLESIQYVINPKAMESQIKNKNIESIPLQFMRGRTFNDCWIICDEAQNMTIEQAKMLCTRVGENCKLIINGDIKQSDLGGKYAKSGLAYLVHEMRRQHAEFEIVEFTLDDCVRSGLCKKFLTLFDRAED